VPLWRFLRWRAHCTALQTPGGQGCFACSPIAAGARGTWTPWRHGSRQEGARASCCCRKRALRVAIPSHSGQVWLRSPGAQTPTWEEPHAPRQLAASQLTFCLLCPQAKAHPQFPRYGGLQATDGGLVEIHVSPISFNSLDEHYTCRSAASTAGSCKLPDPGPPRSRPRRERSR
jgi:hypothetical protein